MFRTILINPLFNLLALIYAVVPGHDFGIAVIILTIIFRLALWPLATKQLHSQKAMQELQPEVVKVRARAKGDKQKEAQMLMELYKEKEISPFASLGLLFVQLPLFIALYIGLRDFVKAGSVAHLAYGPIKQLAPIQAIIAAGSGFHPTLLGLIDLTKPNWVLAVLAAAAQFYQTKQLSPKVPAGQPDPTKIMTTLFPFLTFFIALKLPSALALYWVATSLVAIAQQYWVLERDVAELEGKGGGK